MKDKLLGYVRVSTKAQDAKRQIELIHAHARKTGAEVVAIAKDKGVSGATSMLTREGLSKVYEADPSTYDYIVVSELSRITRGEDDDLWETGTQLRNLINTTGKRLYILDCDRWIGQEDCRELNRIIMLLCQLSGTMEERKKIKERMRTGRATRVSIDPRSCSGGRAFGYRTAAENVNGTTIRVLKVDETKRSAVRTIFERVANGESLRSVGADYGKQACNIKYIINNPIYKGEKTTKFNGGHTSYIAELAIVDESLWGKANEVISSHIKPRNMRHVNPARRLFFCWDCGGLLMHARMKFKHTDATYLRCNPCGGLLRLDCALSVLRSALNWAATGKEQALEQVRQSAAITNHDRDEQIKKELRSAESAISFIRDDIDFLKAEADHAMKARDRENFRAYTAQYLSKEKELAQLTEDRDRARQRLKDSQAAQAQLLAAKVEGKADLTDEELQVWAESVFRGIDVAPFGHNCKLVRVRWQGSRVDYLFHRGEKLHRNGVRKPAGLYHICGDVTERDRECAKIAIFDPNRAFNGLPSVTIQVTAKDLKNDSFLEDETGAGRLLDRIPIE